jgi:hypothetical protein
MIYVLIIGFLVSGLRGALIGTALALAALVALANRRHRRAHAEHHRQLEPGVGTIEEAYRDGRVDDMAAALDSVPYKRFDQGCRTCLELLHRTMPARSDLGSARWFVNEHAYTLAEAWTIVRAFGGDRSRYEAATEQRMQALASRVRAGRLRGYERMTRDAVSASQDGDAAEAREARARERLGRLREAIRERRRERGL